MSSYLVHVNAYCRYVRSLASAARRPVSVVPLLLMRSDGWRTDFRVDQLTLSARRSDLVAVSEVASDGEYAFLRDLPFPGGDALVLDLGANIGCFAASVFSRWPNAEVHSVEPSPDTYAVLNDNRKRHPRLAWHTHRVALAAVNGTRLFDNHGPSTARRLSTGREGVPVGAETFDHFVARVAGGRRVFLCKMDIEGAEAAIFAGPVSALARIDHFIVELHGSTDETGPIIDRLSSLFPHLTTVPRRRSAKPLIYAWRRPAASLESTS